MTGRWLLAGALVVAWGGPNGAGLAQRADSPKPPGTRNLERIAGLPLSFVPDATPDVFVARGPGYGVRIDPAGVTLRLVTRTGGRPAPGVGPMAEPEARTAIRLAFAGASRPTAIRGVDTLAGVVNVHLGADRARWRTGVPTYARVVHEGIYPGIDAVFYGDGRQLEYDFVVAPGADPTRIALTFDGIDLIELDGAGDLVLHTAGGTVRQRRPRTYQDFGGERREIDGGYERRGSATFGFRTMAYDAGRPLVIDPTVSYASYIGGSLGEVVNDGVVDGMGRIHLTGSTSSEDFGAGFSGATDVFVMRLNPDGSAVEYLTLVGGTGPEDALGLALDPASGHAVIAGTTLSTDFPTPGGVQPLFGGGATDAFVSRIDQSGMLAYSTYVGGSGNDEGRGVALDDMSHAYLTGVTRSDDYPTTDGAFDETFNGVADAFVTKLTVDLSAIVYSTYLGGSFYDESNAIDVRDGRAHVGGMTFSDDYPVQNADQPTTAGGGDAFISAINQMGSGLEFSTYLGGSGFDAIYGLAIVAAAAGPPAVAVAGETSSAEDFPLLNPVQPNYGGGMSDAFVGRYDTSGIRLFVTYAGGNGVDVAFDIEWNAAGMIGISGATDSVNFPIVNPIQSAIGSMGLGRIGKQDDDFFFSYTPFAGTPSRRLPIDVESGDVNGDGLIDVVVVRVDPDDRAFGEIVVFTAAPDGSFSEAQVIPVFPAPEDIELADSPFDGDGDLDILMAGSAITVFTNVGNGEFVDSVVLTLRPYRRVEKLAGGPGNDGFVAVPAEGNEVHLFRSAGPRGGFRPAEIFALASAAVDLATGKLDTDEFLDFLVASPTFIEAFYLTATSATRHSLALGASDVDIADLDGDGTGEIIKLEGPFVSYVPVFDRVFGPETTIFMGSEPKGLAVVRLNLDMRDDLVIHDFGQALLFTTQAMGFQMDSAECSSNTPRFDACSPGSIFATGCMAPDAFVQAYNSHDEFVYGSYFGGEGSDKGRCVDIDDQGGVMVCGNTEPPGLPFVGPGTPGLSANLGGPGDGFVVRTTNDDDANRPPIAVDDSFSTPENVPLTVAAPGVLANDSDPDGDLPTADLVGIPANGEVDLNADGSFTYTPDPGFSGTDTFTYVASDGQSETPATVTITVTPANRPPVAETDEFPATFGVDLVVPPRGVLANDNDPDGDDLTASLVAGAVAGKVVLNTDGSFTYTPPAEFQELDSFVYAANDGRGGTDTAVVFIRMSPGNRPPVAVADTYTVAEDGTLTPEAGVLANDSDPDGDPLTAQVATQPSNGTLTFNEDGSFTYTPDADYNGPDEFTYHVSDGQAESAPATVRITVAAVPDPPKAVGDSFETDEDTRLSVGKPGVLANDTDPDGDVLTAEPLTEPQHGQVTLHPDGSFTYTPTADYAGPDGFSYQADDGHGGTAVAQVTILVRPVNDPPVAHPDAHTVGEDGQLVVPAPGVIANDNDPDSLLLFAEPGVPPQHGRLEFDVTGGFTYTPNPDFAGVDEFTYRVTDGELASEPVTVTITVNAVNDPPVARPNGYTVGEDGVLQVQISVLDDDLDADGDALTAIQVTGAAHGSVAFNPDGSFTYTPDADFHGTDSFTYRASDGQATSDPATVTIEVTAVNDPPRAAGDFFGTTEDALAALSGNVLGNDSDPDGDPLTAALRTGPPNGTLTFNPDGSFTYRPNADFSGLDTFTYVVNDGAANSEPATVVITVIAVNDPPRAADDFYVGSEDSGPTLFVPSVLANDVDPDGDLLIATLLTQPANGVAAMNPDGTFTYTPNANFNGNDSFTYSVSDGSEGGFSTATVKIVVLAVNDPPVGRNDRYQMDEDGVLVEAPSVLANDSDAEGDELTATLVSSTTHGTLLLFRNGTFFYTPELNFNGTDTFTYRAGDGLSESEIVTVTIVVAAVNDAPFAAPDRFTTPEDTQLVESAPGVIANDTDFDGDPLTAQLGVGPSHGTVVLGGAGGFTYTPNRDFTGTDTFTYRVTDGLSASEPVTVTIEVTPVNDPPAAGPNGYTVDEDDDLFVLVEVGVLIDDRDAENEPLTAELVTGTSHGFLTLAPDGSFTYTPTADFFGTDSFTYRARDGQSASDPATVVIEVRNVNDPPVTVGDFYHTDEDVDLNVSGQLGVRSNDDDVDGDDLTVELVHPPFFGRIELFADGSFSYKPNPDTSGPDAFSYRVFDGTVFSEPETVSIEVRPVNDAPKGAADAFPATEDQTLRVDAPGVLANDSDADDDDVLTAEIVTGPSHGIVLLGPDGRFEYTPEPDFKGEDSFTYRVSDGSTQSDPVTVTISVAAVNDPPVAAPDAYQTNEDTVLQGTTVLANDRDPDGDRVTIELTLAPLGSLEIFEDGTFRYEPPLNHHGTDTFRYRLSDGQAQSESVEVTITIASVNDPPVARPNAYTTDEDHVLNVPAGTGLLADDEDADRDPLTAVPETGASHGRVQLFPDGSFTYTPDPNYHGSDSFTYRTSDGTSTSDPATVLIEIAEVNDLPVNRPPVVDAGPDQTVIRLDLVSFQGTANDPDGDQMTFRWDFGDGSPQQPGLQTEHRFLTAGTYTVTLTATDVHGASSTDTLQVTVKARNGNPTISAFTNVINEGHEGQKSLRFTVTLSEPSDKVVTVEFGTRAFKGEGSRATADLDYRSRAGTLFFQPGSKVEFIDVTVLGDRIHENNERFLLMLRFATNAELAADDDPTPGFQVVGEIQNDDLPPRLTINDIRLAEGQRGFTNFIFTVTLSNASELPVGFSFQSEDGDALAGSDYLEESGRAVVPPGALSYGVRVRVRRDRDVEDDELFGMTIFEPVNAEIADGRALGKAIIVNDDPDGRR